MAQVSGVVHRGGHRAGSTPPASTRSPAPAPRCSPARPRTAIAPLKESGERWLEVMETAHGLGVESTATLHDGHRRDQRRAHRAPADDPRRAGPHRRLPRRSSRGPTSRRTTTSRAAPRPRSLEYLRLIAVARLFFDNVAHLQGSWLTTGKDVGQLSLHYRRRRPRLDHAGGERRLLGRRQAPLQPARADPPDPHGRPHPGPARHALPPPRRALDARRTTRPTTRVVSHFSSTALPGGGLGTQLPLVASS